MRPQNDSTIALSLGAPTAPIEGARPASRTFWLNAQEVGWTPRSLCSTRPASGLRVLVAMPSAVVTSAVVWVLSIDQPTTRRENASKTTQQNTLPSRVGCSVMSVIHSSLGAARTKSRRTRSNERWSPTFAPFGSRRVGSPRSPRRRMMSATALWPTTIARAWRSSAVTRSDP